MYVGMLNCEIATETATEMGHFPRRVHLRGQEVKQEWQEPCIDEQETPRKSQTQKRSGQEGKAGTGDPENAERHCLRVWGHS